MNILYITNHLNIGGITSYVFTLASGLVKKGHNIYVASSGGGCLEEFIAEGINYIPVPLKTKKEISPRIIWSKFKLERLIKEKDIQLLHVHSRTTQVLGCLLQKKTRIPYVSTCHGFFKPRFLRRVFPCWGQRVIAISESVKEHLIRNFKVNEKIIRVIHNGIDVNKFIVRSSEFKVNAKKNLRLNDGSVVGIVARLSDVKGHIYLIRAMKQVIDEIPQAQLLIVGEGKMKEELVKLTYELGIEKKVHFLPEVRDTREVLSTMDLFVLPSLKEGLGLALMEAMASGLAVIGSDIGGIRSLIRDGENGLLAKVTDSQDLAAKIISLLQAPEKRRFFGKAARDFMAKNFSQEKMILETKRVYLECLSAKD